MMEAVVSGPAAVLTASALFAAALLCFEGLGSPFWRLPVSAGSAQVLLRPVAAVGCGFFAASLAVLALAAAGFLRAPVLAAAALAAAFAGVRSRLRHFGAEKEALGRAWKNCPRAGLILVAAVWALLIVTFIGAQAPEIGNDALAYHLYFPKLYAQAGGFVHDPFHSRSLWPSMMGMLYAAGLLLQGTALAKLFAWLPAALTVLAVPLGARLLGFSRGAAGWSALLIAAVPAIWQQSLYAYTDNAMMFFAFLWFVSLWAGERSGWRFRDCAAPALLLGALLSIKYFTLPIAFFILVSFLLTAGSGGWAARLRALAVIGAGAAALSGFWFVRSWMETGNPVYPFAAGLFEGNGFSQRMVGFAVLPKNFLNFLLSPWSAAIRVDVFGGEPIGPLFLAALPLAAGFRRLEPPARAALIFSALFWTFWFLTIQHARFLFSLFPFLALGFGVLLARWSEGARTAAAVKGIFAVTAFLSGMLSLYYAALPARAALSDRGAAYLAARERSYAFFRQTNGVLGPHDKILFVNEPRLFYSPVPASLFNPALLRQRGIGPAEFGGWLADQKITHALFLSRRGAPGEGALPEGYHLPSPVLEASATVTTADGRFDYRLWRIAA